MDDTDRYQVYVFVADGKPDEDVCRYTVEHWFAERPDVETVEALLGEAKRHFTTIYPGVEAENYSVEVSRLRPRDVSVA